MPSATATSKGQITLPIKVRKTLGITTGTKVNFVPYNDSYILHVAQTDPLDELEGFFGYEGPAYSVDDMDATIRARVMSTFEKGTT